ncbi:MAG: response regulator [Oscillospiraceae bacterium]|nr:response regulator [Oscillospiraceae bacterium]
MIVDDSKFMRRMMREIAARNGFTVVAEAENGRVAISKYDELKPDIVTMDVTMSEMNGLEALAAILEKHPDAKIVMVSSMSQEIIVREAIVLGARGFIVKPYEEKQVITAFLKILS